MAMGEVGLYEVISDFIIEKTLQFISATLSSILPGDVIPGLPSNKIYDVQCRLTSDCTECEV